MSGKKHPPPRWCHLRRALVGASPSAFAWCGLGLIHRARKCKGCTENVGERIQEGFEEGLRKGAEIPSIHEQLRAHAVEKLKEMPQPTLTYDINAIDLAALETGVNRRLVESVEVTLDEHHNIVVRPKK